MARGLTGDTRWSLLAPMAALVRAGVEVAEVGEGIAKDHQDRFPCFVSCIATLVFTLSRVVSQRKEQQVLQT